MKTNKESWDANVAPPFAADMATSHFFKPGGKGVGEGGHATNRYLHASVSEQELSSELWRGF